MPLTYLWSLATTSSPAPSLCPPPRGSRTTASRTSGKTLMTGQQWWELWSAWLTLMATWWGGEQSLTSPMNKLWPPNRVGHLRRSIFKYVLVKIPPTLFYQWHIQFLRIVLNLKNTQSSCQKNLKLQFVFESQNRLFKFYQCTITSKPPLKKYCQKRASFYNITNQAACCTSKHFPVL